MSSVKQAVERDFGKIISLFAFPDYSKKLKAPPTKYYIYIFYSNNFK